MRYEFITIRYTPDSEDEIVDENGGECAPYYGAARPVVMILPDSDTVQIAAIEVPR